MSESDYSGRKRSVVLGRSKGVPFDSTLFLDLDGDDASICFIITS